MPAIKKISYTTTFSQLNDQSFKHGETNDCAVKAVALVTEKLYSEAHRALADRGRKTRQGTPFRAIDETIKEFGYKVERVDPREIIAAYPSPHRDVLKNITTHHPRRFNKVWPKGTYLLYSRAHVSAVIDGELHDWAVNRAKRVWRIDRIVKA